VFNLPSTRVVQLKSRSVTSAPDNATAWQPSVFDCSLTPLLLTGYFQHTECANFSFCGLFGVTAYRYVRPVASELSNHFLFRDIDICSSAILSLRASTNFPFVISVHVRRGDNVRVHNGPSITRAIHPAYIVRAVERVLHRMDLNSSNESVIAILFTDSAPDYEWCATHVKLSIPSVIPAYSIDSATSKSVLIGFNITGCGNGAAPPWCKLGHILHLSPGQVLSASRNLFGGDAAELCLMSLCDSWVLSPSTFGWWGAWLGSQRLSQELHTVVLPLPWYNAVHATTGTLDASGLLWDHRWEWLQLDSEADLHQHTSYDAAIEIRQPDGGWNWNPSSGPFVFRFYVWDAHGGGVNLFIDDVLIGGPYPPFHDVKLEFPHDMLSPGKRVLFFSSI
jgi:hypothetical protein